MDNSVKYPNIKVKLTGTDGNAFSILAKVRQALKSNKVSNDEITQFTNKAQSGDYNNLLCTCCKWVSVS